MAARDTNKAGIQELAGTSWRRKRSRSIFETDNLRPRRRLRMKKHYSMKKVAEAEDDHPCGESLKPETPKQLTPRKRRSAKNNNLLVHKSQLIKKELVTDVSKEDMRSYCTGKECNLQQALNSNAQKSRKDNPAIVDQLYGIQSSQTSHSIGRLDSDSLKQMHYVYCRRSQGEKIMPFFRNMRTKNFNFMRILSESMNEEVKGSHKLSRKKVISSALSKERSPGGKKQKESITKKKNIEQRALVTIKEKKLTEVKLEAKVDLDIDTIKEWEWLMGKSEKEENEDTEMAEKYKEKWEKERELFRGRIASFISRMHIIQGNRRFSPWKGSVVDSVAGAFLTQNVSDISSSSAFMSLAAHYPNRDISSKMSVPSVESDSIDKRQIKNLSTEEKEKEVNRKEVVMNFLIRKTEKEGYSVNHRDNIRKLCAQFDDKMRTDDTTSSALDWNAVSSSHVDDISKAITDRGMDKKLAERIKNCIDLLKKELGSIDLEWLRNAPPENAKEYLLSIYGLGLKSVECIRLLTLQHQAFPVDINVGRVLVRLGWVPIHLLPNSQPMHLLKKYPHVNSIHKYIWPRLCTLDHLTLYEFHTQMITFGKVFCTKERPNCNACPMRAECRHFASAFTSASLTLPVPQERSLVGPVYPQPQVDNSINTEQALLTLADGTPPSADDSIKTEKALAILPEERNLSESSLVGPVYQQSADNSIRTEKELVILPEELELSERSLVGSVYSPSTDNSINTEEALVTLPGEGDLSERSLVGSFCPLSADTSVDSEMALVTLPEECCGLSELGHLPVCCEQGSGEYPLLDQVESTERDMEDLGVAEIPTIKFDKKTFMENLLTYMEESRVMEDNLNLSNALIVAAPEAASIPLPKWKSISRLRTEHQVYELPDTHPLVIGLEAREPDDPCRYLLAIIKKPADSSMTSKNRPEEEDDVETIQGTLLIPCRTATKGRFPLNGTYFQVNEVFADYESSKQPISVPRAWVWELRRKTLYCGTSIKTIFRGMSTEDVQRCFWEGYVCVRAFNRKTGNPLPLPPELHLPVSKTVKSRIEKTKEKTPELHLPVCKAVKSRTEKTKDKTPELHLPVSKAVKSRIEKTKEKTPELHLPVCKAVKSRTEKTKDKTPELHLPVSKAVKSRIEKTKEKTPELHHPVSKALKSRIEKTKVKTPEFHLSVSEAVKSRIEKRKAKTPELHLPVSKAVKSRIEKTKEKRDRKGSSKLQP